MVSKALIVIGLAMLLAGCQTTAPIRCWGAPIIVDSGYETRLTHDEKAQILAHNETGASVCGW